MELYWFVTDKDDKVIPTGNWNKMPIRKTQACFRNYTDNGATTVHLIDLISGKKATIEIEEARAMTSEKLKKLLKKKFETSLWKQMQEKAKEVEKEQVTSIYTMKGFSQAKTLRTPEILLDYHTGVLKIEGTAGSQQAHDLFNLVMQHLKQNPGKITNVEIKLDFFDTSSSKWLLDILKYIEKNGGAKVRWYYEEDDEDMMEAGEDYAAIINVKFDIVSYIK